MGVSTTRLIHPRIRRPEVSGRSCRPLSFGGLRSAAAPSFVSPSLRCSLRWRIRTNPHLASMYLRAADQGQSAPLSRDSPGAQFDLCARVLAARGRTMYRRVCTATIELSFLALWGRQPKTKIALVARILQSANRALPLGAGACIQASLDRAAGS